MIWTLLPTALHAVFLSLVFLEVNCYLAKLDDSFTEQHSAFTLIGYSGEPISVPEETDVSLSHCGEFCKKTRELCIGFQWLPHEQKNSVGFVTLNFNNIKCIPNNNMYFNIFFRRTLYWISKIRANAGC